MCALREEGAQRLAQIAAQLQGFLQMRAFFRTQAAVFEQPAGHAPAGCGLRHITVRGKGLQRNGRRFEHRQDWTHEEKKGEQQRQQIEAGFRCRMQRAEFGAD
ncbi:hypothetical protein HUU39_12640, partial [candidate division KSB1 bacterium]|nr:hypothetical protein [candidate division KSB1 bacterium]